MLGVPRILRIWLIALSLTLAGSLANAGPILYSPLPGATVQVKTFEPVGQSFVAEDELVEAGLHFSIINGTFDPTDPIRYDLYLGQGIGGSLVASVAFALTSGIDDFFHMEDFSSTPLMIGSTYSLVASVVGTSPYWAVTRSLEPPAGTGIGDLFPSYRYALSVNPIPEPNTAVLLSLGLVGLGIRRRHPIKRVRSSSQADPPFALAAEQGEPRRQSENRNGQ